MAGFGEIIREMVVRISVDTKGTKAGLQVMEDRLQNIRQILMGIKDVGVFISRTVFTFAKAGANLESMEIKFGTLARSMELGKEKLEELNHFATVTPFTLGEVRKNTSMLMAMGVALEDVIPTMTKLGNVTAGLPNMSLERLALNFGQVKSQGWLTGRELRDFAVGGVPLMESLKDITGKTDAQLRDMMKDKKISFDMVNKAFDYMVSKEGRFHKLLDKMANSAEGLYNNIKVTWDLIKEGVGKEVLKDLKPLLKEFKDYLSENRERIIQRIKGAIIKLSKVLVMLYKAVFKIVKSMLPFIEVMAEGLAGILQFYAGILNFISSSPNFVRALKLGIYLLGIFVAGFVVRNIIMFSKGISTAALALGELSPALMKGAIRMGIFSKTWHKSLLSMVKAAAPFLAVGAIIVGIFLILEDMYVYTMGLLEGRETDTYTGDIINGLTKGQKKLKEELDRLVRILVTPFAGITALLELSWLKIVGTDKEFDQAYDKHVKRLKWITDAFKETDFTESFAGYLEILGKMYVEAHIKWNETVKKMGNSFFNSLGEMFVEAQKKWNEFWSFKDVDFSGMADTLKVALTKVFDTVIKHLENSFPLFFGSLRFLADKLGIISKKPLTMPNMGNIIQETQLRQSFFGPENFATAPGVSNTSYDQSRRQTVYNQQSYTFNNAPGSEILRHLENQQSKMKSMEDEYSGGNQ